MILIGIFVNMNKMYYKYFGKIREKYSVYIINIILKVIILNKYYNR